MSLPAVRKYETYRDFLTALTDKANGTFTSLELSKLAGFKSASGLSMVMGGSRKLSLLNAEKLAANLFNLDIEKEYFMLLVKSEHAKNPDEKESIETLLKSLRNLGPRSEIKDSEIRFVTIWFYPVLYAMAASGKLKLDSERIAKKLGNGVTVEQVKRAVGDLLNLHFFKLQDGYLKQDRGHLFSKEEFSSQAIRSYHRAMLQLAAESLKLAPSEREFGGLTITIPKSKLALAKQKLKDFRKYLGELLRGDEEGEVYQLNLQLFPLTQKLE